MANGHRSVSTARKLIATVLGTFATFIILFGAGMTSWAIAALGVALLVLAVSLVLITAFPGTERAWVAGIAHVRSVSEPPASSTYGRCELQILVDAPGVPPRSVKVRDPRVPVAKWPDPGATLPIMVAIDDQRHVRIIWDDVLTHAEAAAERADLPPEFDEPDFSTLDDDLLDVDEEPPWARRRSDDLFLDPDTAQTADLGAGLRDDDPAEPAGPADDPRQRRRDPAENPRPDFATPGFDPDIEQSEPADPGRVGNPGKDPGKVGDPVVVSQSPGGHKVVDGTVVDPQPVPLPRRARPRPYSPPAEPEAGTVTAGADRGRAAAEARAESPTATGTALADQPDQDADDPDGGSVTDPDGPLADLAAAGPVTGTDTLADEPDDHGPIHGVGLTLLVADLDRSVGFYRDMLGFFEIDGGDGNAVLASGQTRLVLRSVPEVAPVNRRLMHLNLEVDGLQRMHDELKAKGVRFTYAPRAVNRGARLELWAAAFRDPDGHGIAIIEWRDRDQPATDADAPQ